MKNTRILLLSGGCLVGQMILDVLRHRRKKLTLIATNSVADALPLPEFDTVYLTPTTCGDPLLFEEQILQIIQDEKPDLVIPCRDDDTLFLASLRERYPDLSPKFLCGNYTSSQIMVDKGLSWTFSDEQNLPFAPTLITPVTEGLDAFAKEQGFPLLAKPKMGFAAHGVFFILNQEQLNYAANLDNYIIQKFLGDPSIIDDYVNNLAQSGIPLFHTFEGIKHSIQIFIGPDGSPQGNFCSRNVNRYGTSLRLERYDGQDAKILGEECISVFAKAGWRGPINVQCQRTPQGKLFIYEYNNRITGASAARYHMGYDELGISLKTFLGIDIMADNPPRSEVVLRHTLDTTLKQDVVSHLEQNKVWRNPRTT